MAIVRFATITAFVTFGAAGWSMQAATLSNTAPIILALATLVTAIGGTFVLVLQALRTKRIEEKVDVGAVVQEKIHLAVNSNMAAAVKKIDEGTAELREAKEEISRLKADAVTEIKAELGRFRDEQSRQERKY